VASLLAVGTARSSEATRGDVMAAMASRAAVTLLSVERPRWVAKYIRSFQPLPSSATVDAMLARGRDVMRRIRAAGIMTFDDRYVVPVAMLAEEFGFPGAGARAATACKDKWAGRTLLADAALGGVEARLVHTAEEAVAAADEIGLPVVLKPRALSASIGVGRADSLEDVRARFEVAAAMTVPDPVYMVPGVLVEEFVDGPEFSIDSLVRRGLVRPLFVASKLSGLAPYFEELGHVVSSDGLELLPGIAPFLRVVHEVIGFADGATHAEVRVTERGYRLMEINARLGGDLIPHLGLLATGIDLPVAAVDVALGKEPDLRPSATGAVAIRFIYPPRDMELREIRIPPEVLQLPGVVAVRPLVSPGTRLLLPPRAFWTRVAFVIVRGETSETCSATVDEVVERIAVVGA
jgi:biotin carboxylase